MVKVGGTGLYRIVLGFVNWGESLMLLESFEFGVNW